MSDFSDPTYDYGVADIAFPFEQAQAAREAVTRLLGVMRASAEQRNAAADRALANWTGAYGDSFRIARDNGLDGHKAIKELENLKARLQKALDAYEHLQKGVVDERERAVADLSRRGSPSDFPRKTRRF